MADATIAWSIRRFPYQEATSPFAVNQDFGDYFWIAEQPLKNKTGECVGDT
jgi:hypothetical protein